jgi:hypothetical protein
MTQKRRPWSVGINGMTTNIDEGGAARDYLGPFYQSLTELVDMQKAKQIAGMVGSSMGEPAQPSSTTEKITDVVKAFGIDIPEMTKERDKLLLQMQDAKGEAAKAQHSSEIARLEAAIKGIENGHDRNDPLRDLTMQMITRKLSEEPQGDPEVLAIKQYRANKVIEEMERAENPPTISDQVKNMGEMLTSMREMGSLMNGSPQQVGLPADKQLELEVKKLEIEQQIALYRINKDVETQATKASAWKDIAGMLGGSIEGIGRALADQWLQTSPTPGAMPVATPASYAPSETMSSLDCPACNEAAVLVNSEMAERITLGETVDAVCGNCGATHQIGNNEASEEPIEEPEEIITAPPGRRVIKAIVN